ncbi:hypothetical protein A2110_02600 [Candidatus Jorgensenbacteria bacterium GWA1_54_12]|uniref:Uncharacterized protein n=1 Tax=Candidatus Jorgensenbacteria bacterium GWA1_54_12 TaxID=1798468 RepID=A0A1F6BKK3_9BACT|nr:MAG: hypothetical protein A2110_02600 [Candidatus Jorgensenbacteria bacterium GWA1_54_12]
MPETGLPCYKGQRGLVRIVTTEENDTVIVTVTIGKRPKKANWRGTRSQILQRAKKLIETVERLGELEFMRSWDGENF